MKRVLVVLVLAALAGCGGGGKEESATDATFEGPAKVGNTPPTEPTTIPEPTTIAVPTGPFAVGDKVRTVRGNFAQLYGWLADVPPPSKAWTVPAGKHFAAADLEFCAEEVNDINPFYFDLEMPDHTRIKSYSGIKDPALNHANLQPGECVRGWVSYAVPNGQEPVSLVFTSTIGVKWNLPV
jgi:hypothetical protein